MLETAFDDALPLTEPISEDEANERAAKLLHKCAVDPRVPFDIQFQIIQFLLDVVDGKLIDRG